MDFQLGSHSTVVWHSIQPLFENQFWNEGTYRRRAISTNSRYFQKPPQIRKCFEKFSQSFRKKVFERNPLTFYESGGLPNIHVEHVDIQRLVEGVGSTQLGYLGGHHSHRR